MMYNAVSPTTLSCAESHEQDAGSEIPTRTKRFMDCADLDRNQCLRAQMSMFSVIRCYWAEIFRLGAIRGARGFQVVM